MVDHVAVTPGAGATIATDDVAGVQYQVVKLDVGGDGASTPVSGALPVSAAGLTSLAAAIHVEDDPVGTGDSGMLILAVRNDAGTVLAGTTLDAIPLSTNSSGNLRTLAVGSASEDAALAGNPIPVGMKANAAAPAAMSTDGDTVIPWALLNGSQVVNVAFGGSLLVQGRAAAAASIPVALSNEDVLDQFITGQGAQTAAGQNIMLAVAGTGSVDAQQYRTVSIQIVPTGTVSSGVVTFEGSNDNVTFVVVTMYDAASPGTANPASTISPATGVSRFMFSAVQFRYIRARISTVIGGGGSLQAFTLLRMVSLGTATQSISQLTAGNLLCTATVSGTVTATGITGTVAHDAVGTSNPVRVALRAHNAAPAAVSADGDTQNWVGTMVGAALVKPFAIPESDWLYAAAAGGILNTTVAVTIKAAAAAGIRNYVTGIDIMAEAVAVATELAIRDGAAGTVIWRTKIGTGGQPLTSIRFANPLRGSAATLLEVVTLTATTTGAVYFNATGYVAP